MATPTDERLVKIKWEGPLSLEEALARCGDDDYGIYQVYGHHVVFGDNALLYIGMARDQTFGVRLRGRFDEVNDVTFRLGRISTDSYEDDADWYELVKDVEALTIWWHSPPYNSQNITSYNGPSLRVQAWKDRGRLLPEYSSQWASEAPPRPDE